MRAEGISRAGANSVFHSVEAVHSLVSSLDSALTVTVNTGVPLAPLAGTNLHMVGADGVNNALSMTSYGGNCTIQLRVAGGTQASQTVLSSGSTAGSINGLGWDGTTYGTAGAVAFRMAEVWSATAHGGDLVFR